MRIVDDAEPLMQLAQRVHRVARGLLHRLADAMGDRIEPLVDRARHLGLAAGQRLRHRVDPAGGLGLRAHHVVEALFQLVGARGLHLRQQRVALARTPHHDGDDQEQQQRERGKADQRVGEVDRPVADQEQSLVHAPV